MSALVFLSHSTADMPVVEELARRLAEEGIEAWLDKWNLIPGDPWQPAIEEALVAEFYGTLVRSGSGTRARGRWKENHPIRGTTACGCNEFFCRRGY
jgi:hypothetical protein